MARILIGNIKGPQGIPGNKGDKGDIGPQGPPGPAGAVDNTTPIEFTEAAQLANLVSGDAINVLFGKQKKWNANINPIKEVIYSNATKEEALNKLNNPLTLFGFETSKPYYMLFNDIVGDSLLGGGVHCIYGYEILSQNYGTQLVISYGIKGKGNTLKVRSKYNGVWSDLFPVYNGLSGLSPADIGAASAGELTSCRSNWGEMLKGEGWYRIASVNSYSPIGCTVSLKRAYTSNTDESHKCRFISVHDSKYIFKSIYDSSGAHLIKKIRLVKKIVSGQTYHCIDIYYNSASSNIFIATLEDIICGDSTRRWKMESQLQTVPETATGETVLATLEFEANSWLGGSL